MYKLKSFKNLLKHLALSFVKPAIINMYVNWTKKQIATGMQSQQ